MFGFVTATEQLLKGYQTKHLEPRAIFEYLNQEETSREDNQECPTDIMKDRLNVRVILVF